MEPTVYGLVGSEPAVVSIEDALDDAPPRLIVILSSDDVVATVLAEEATVTAGADDAVGCSGVSPKGRGISNASTLDDTEELTEDSVAACTAGVTVSVSVLSSGSVSE